jgi:hypothetical protein
LVFYLTYTTMHGNTKVKFITYGLIDENLQPLLFPHILTPL